MQSQIVPHLAALQTLLAVVDTGSLTDAARRSGLTPSGVSKQLARLEEALGVRLLERTTRSVRPTLAGLDLCQRARPLFESFDDAARAVRDHALDTAGRVRVSASPSFGKAVLLPVLERLAHAHPGLRFEATFTGRRLDFVEDDIDVAVREGPLDDSSLIARPLAPAVVGLYASEAYLAARAAPRRIADLARHDLLTIPSSASLLRTLHPSLRSLQLSPRFVVDDLYATAALAEHGLGIAPLPDYVARAFVARRALTRVLPKADIARVALNVVYPSKRHLPRRVELLIDALLAADRKLTASRSPTAR